MVTMLRREARHKALLNSHVSSQTTCSCSCQRKRGVLLLTSPGRANKSCVVRHYCVISPTPHLSWPGHTLKNALHVLLGVCRDVRWMTYRFAWESVFCHFEGSFTFNSGEYVWVTLPTIKYLLNPRNTWACFDIWLFSPRPKEFMRRWVRPQRPLSPPWWRRWTSSRLTCRDSARWNVLVAATR